MGDGRLASRISFSEVHLRAPYAPGAAPDPLLTSHLDDGVANLQRRALAAIVGDGGTRLEAG